MIRDYPDEVGQILADQEPFWEPGTDHGFHSTLGLYMDQIVRRVEPSHRSLDLLFQEEIAHRFSKFIPQ